MKTIFRTLGLGIFLAALLGLGGITASAQDACNDVDGINSQYQKVLDNYKTSLPVAIEAGKVFLEKYGNCEVAADNAKWIKDSLPGWEKKVKADDRARQIRELFDKFDTAIQSKTWDVAYATGNEFITKFPDEQPAFLSFMVVPLATIGLYESYPPAKNYKHNADTIKYANSAIRELKSGKQSVKRDKAGKLLPDTFGVYQFECKKDDCISEMTYALAYIAYHAQGNKQQGLTHYYEVTKLPGRNKNNPLVFETIGAFYFDTVRKLAEEVKTMIADQKETDTEEVRTKKEADIKAKIALLNGYAERAMDAYSRAYTIAKGDPKTKAYADTLYKTLQGLHTVRFQKQDGLDTWIATTVTKPLPDPTSAVTPVSDPEPTTGPASSAPAPATSTPNKPSAAKVSTATAKKGTN